MVRTSCSWCRKHPIHVNRKQRYQCDQKPRLVRVACRIRLLFDGRLIETKRSFPIDFLISGSIDENPEEAWATLGPYFLKESQQYSSWRRTGVERSFSNTSQSVQELRATRVYQMNIQFFEHTALKKPGKQEKKHEPN